MMVIERKKDPKAATRAARLAPASHRASQYDID